MKITVVGLGHLGTVAAGGLATAGHDVTGLDIDEWRIQSLRAGQIPFYEPGLQECVVSAVDRGNLRFCNGREFMGNLGNIALIATGTPPAANGEADLSQVHAALGWVKSRMPANLVVVMKSTVPPGSGAAFLRQDLRGLDVDYIANPEFLREGRALQDWNCPDRIVLGADAGAIKAIKSVKRMYSGIEAPFLITDITSAEMIKYANNALLATRISFINEIASLCDEVGASIDAVSDGLAMDGRTGDRIRAGVGYGGSCFPKDIRELQHLASETGLDLDLLRAVTAVNDRQRQLPLELIRSKFNGDLAGIQVGVLGLAFKPGTNDIRHAVSLDLINGLVEQGARVRAFDPQANASARKSLPQGVDFVDSPEETATGAQALVLLTEWAEIVEADWASMAAEMCSPRFLFDGRNALTAALMSRLGFDYTGVGRGNADPRIIRSDSSTGAGAVPPAQSTATVAFR